MIISTSDDEADDDLVKGLLVVGRRDLAAVVSRVRASGVGDDQRGRFSDPRSVLQIPFRVTERRSA